MSTMSQVATASLARPIRPIFLSSVSVSLPHDLAGTTDVLSPVTATWIENLFRRLGRSATGDRIKQLRQAIRLFRSAPRYSGVITCGDLEGLAFAMLQRLRGVNRPAHIMFDCLWYGGSPIKRRWMRYCLKQVDCCVVWASIEIDRYAKTYNVSESKFLFVPHHHTTKRYRFEVGDDGYVFTG